MEYKEGDEDWSDFFDKVPPERRKRFEELMEGIPKDLEEVLIENGEGYHIIAQIPWGVFSTGVKGDRRTYSPVVMLTYGSFPGYPHLGKMSNAITGRLPISRVNYDLYRRVITVNNIDLLVPNDS